MSRLSEIVSEAAEAALLQGAVDSRALATAIAPSLEPEDRDALAVEALTRRIKMAATRGKAALIRAANDMQPDLPVELPRALHIDLDGHMVKLTVEMTQMEFKRAIDIRKDSIKADRAALEQMETAYGLAAPIWAKHPSYTVGRALAEVVKANGKQAA